MQTRLVEDDYPGADGERPQRQSPQMSREDDDLGQQELKQRFASLVQGHSEAATASAKAARVLAVDRPGQGV